MWPRDHEIMNSVNIVILCLPDEAARKAVELVTNPDVVVIDASSAHRVSDGWTYGFPEMAQIQRKAIQSSKRISNPGCYPTGFIAIMRPLMKAGLMFRAIIPSPIMACLDIPAAAARYDRRVRSGR